MAKGYLSRFEQGPLTGCYLIHYTVWELVPYILISRSKESAMQLGDRVLF